MQNSETFSIDAFWQGRQEDAASVTRRLRLYLDLSKSAIPTDLRWRGWLDNDVSFDLIAEPNRLQSFVERWISSEDGVPWPPGGFSPHMVCEPDCRKKDVTGPKAMFNIGNASSNHFTFFSDSDLLDTTDLRLVTYQAMRIQVMAIAHSFQPDWCEAGPIRLGHYFDRRVYNRLPMGLAWMIYFSPPVAALVKPPRHNNMIIEHYSDRSLFLATSTDVFDCANPMHLDAARAIHRQIDMLNYSIPFCGRSGRSKDVPPFPIL